MEDVQIDQGPQIAFSLHYIAKQMGEQNGLRHHDYNRYSAYCTRRLSRLRSSLDFKQGRNRYTMKPMPQPITEPRYLLLLLVQAERAWSSGMQLKAQNASAAVINMRVRAHSIRRFTKAVRYAEILEQFCGSNTPTLCDTKSCIEASAYKLYMQSVLYQEKEQWVEASTTLQKLQQQYIHLRRVSTTMPEYEIIFRNKLDEIDPQLRLCNFHAGGEINIEDDNKVSPSNFSDMNMNALNRNSSDQVWHWRGIAFDIKAEKPKLAIIASIALMKRNVILSTQELCDLKSAKLFDEMISLVKESLLQNPIAEWAESYGQVSAKFQACVELIHAEIMAHRDDISWGHSAGFCLDIIRCLEVERDALLLLKVLFSWRRTDVIISPNAKDSAEGFRYSNLIMQGLSKLLDDESLHVKERKRIQCWNQYAKDCRGLCLAVSKACEDQYAEAYILTSAIANRQKNTNNTTEPMDEHHQRLEYIFSVIQKLTMAAVSKLKCSYLCSLIKNQYGIDDLSLSSSTKTTEAADELGSLIEHVLVPRPSPISCKPQIFDMAISSFEPPDLSARCGTGRASIGGMLKSWWSGNN